MPEAFDDRPQLLHWLILRLALLLNGHTPTRRCRTPGALHDPAVIRKILGHLDNGSGGWSRMYEGGQVFVTPAEGELQHWQVGFNAWTTTGAPQPLGSVLLVRPADAIILLRAMPAPPPPSLQANIADSGNEWLVQGETGEYRYRYLTVSVRSTELDSAVLVRFETDDPPRPFGILEVMPVGGTFDPGRRDYPYRYTTSLGAAHVRSSVAYPTNDAWTEFTIDLAAECAPHPCFRVISVKAIGAVNVRLIRLTEPEPIPQ